MSANIRPQEESCTTARTAKKPTIAVLMTCFNRREQTLRCLEHLFAQDGLPEVDLHTFLLDDASTDGTAEAVRTAFPAVQVLHGTGKLFWNRGMHEAFAHALAQGFDFYLWLNDDTHLVPSALERLLLTSHRLRGQQITAIVTGSTCDALTGERSYGGFCWKPGWQRELEAIEPSAHDPLPCDTMNGNCTLIPHAVAAAVGNLDPHFNHSFGDFDYGFRARAAGFGVYTVPGFVGKCSDNTCTGTWRDRSAPLSSRWRHLCSVKGSPFREWSVYCRRHLGALWPLYAISPYVKTLAPPWRATGRQSA